MNNYLLIEGSGITGELEVSSCSTTIVEPIGYAEFSENSVIFSSF